MRERCAILVMALWAAPAMAQWNLPAPAELRPGDRSYVWSTHYYVHSAPAAQGAGSVPLTDGRGRPLGVSLSPRDFCHAAMEGTVRIDFGNRSEVYNADGIGKEHATDCVTFFPNSGARQKISRQRFAKVGADSPWGLGTSGYRLVPLRTIATDRAFIGAGTVLYVPRLRGMRFTNSDNNAVVHDGYVFAADVGGSIKRCHIDFFGGGQSDGRQFPFTSGKRRPRAIEVYTVRDPQIIARLTADHARRPAMTTVPNVRGCQSSVIGPQQD